MVVFGNIEFIKLTPEQVAVLKDKATERPFSGKWLTNKQDGSYVCAACGSRLFESGAKYDSRSGWPSFDQAIKGSIQLVEDSSHGMMRQEVICANCGSHLGHLFFDGPQETTGQRFCINSLSLDFTAKNSPTD